jgi:GNAT superfamily N-acetyltransferase
VVIADRAVTLRPLGPADIDGLDALYRGLPGRDRYQRFFTEGPPPRRIVERYVTLVSEGGFGVAAVDDAGRLVAEAGYLLLAGGDGEFGITVAPDWRGLGHLLFDSIATHAAEAGVESLQADVLADNRAMLALAARRGYALIHLPEHTVLRITLATASSVPPWPANTPRPRLLVETPGSQWRAAAAAEAAGFHVVSCRGPSAFRTGRCPALRGQRACPLVDGADAVVVALGPDDPHRGALTLIHRFCHADVPVFLQEFGGEVRPAWLPEGMPTLPAGASPAEIATTLQGAVAASP